MTQRAAVQQRHRNSAYLQTPEMATAQQNDSVEMREKPRIPPKPANLRLAAAGVTQPMQQQQHTLSAASTMAAEAVRALHSAGDSPAYSMQSTTRALDAAAATPPAESGQSQHSKNTTPATAAAAVAAGRKRVVADFEFGRTLGEGSYSTVVEATEKATGKVFAAKILDKRHIIKEKKIKYVNIERDVLHALHHPFIVRLHYAFQDAHSLYFVIDIASNGELLSWIRKLGALSDECVRFYLAELIVAVEYMHMEHTLHRDIKPENILLGDDMHILVTDFGTAKMFGKDDTEMRAYSFVGTAEYVSPELLTDKAADRDSDLWAIGCIAFQLLTGRPPFKGVNEYQTFQKVLKLDYSFPASISPVARDMVERILVVEPGKRLGSVQRGGLKELKEHPFFDSFDWQTLATRTPPRMAPASSNAAAAAGGSSSVTPPAIPPKPAVLRQSTGGLSADMDYASSDGLDTLSTPDSLPVTPDALSSYQLPPMVSVPVSPRETPVRIANPRRPSPGGHLSSGGGGAAYNPPPPPPPHPQSQYQESQLQFRDGIYDVRMNDHVPPMRAEEMAAVQGSRYTSNDYYSTSYRPPAPPTRGGRPTTYRNMESGSSRSSWSSRLKSIFCCGK